MPGGRGGQTKAAAAVRKELVTTPTKSSETVDGEKGPEKERADWASLVALSDVLIGKLTVMRNQLAHKVAEG
jgi:hypothetical protein